MNINKKRIRNISIFLTIIFIIILNVSTPYIDLKTKEDNIKNSDNNTRFSLKNKEELILAATLDGEAVSTFPNKEDNYGVESISCTDDLAATFDPLTWSITVNGLINNNTTCIVNFSSNIILDETSDATTISKSELYNFYKGSFTTTATSSEVLIGKTVYINGIETTGTMADNGTINGSITTSGGTYTIPAGYTTGGNITGPTLSSLVGNNVTLASNANLLTGYTAYGTDGVKYTGGMANNGTLNWSPTTSTTYTVPAGYYSGGTLNTSGAYNAGYAAGKSANFASSLSGTVSLWMERERTYERVVIFSKRFASTPSITCTPSDSTFTISIKSKSPAGFIATIKANYYDGTTKSFTWKATG